MFQPQHIIVPKKRVVRGKTCPVCEAKFVRARKMWVDWASREAPHCPDCNAPLHYSKRRGDTVVIILEDFLTVDTIVRRLSKHLSDMSGFPIDEGTQAEYAFGYRLLDDADKLLGGSESDIGLKLHDFLIQFFNWILEDDWWGSHLRSLLQLSNSKARLMWDFYEHMALKNGVQTPRSDKTRKKLKELIKRFGETDDSDI